MVLEEIPGEKQEKLSPEETDNISRKKHEEGIQYLKKLKTFLQENIDEFSEYASFEAGTRDSIAHNTGSILSL